MLLAELEVFHSRPIAPTRRVALGITVLPLSPAPGYGGLLLGGIAAAFVPDVDPDLLDELDRLTRQLEAGQRVAQPRLRHRFQEDQVGLARCRHRLIGTGRSIVYDLDDEGSGAPNVLGAVYAAARLDPDHRRTVFEAIRRGLRWQGPVGPELIDHLSDSRGTLGWATLGGKDPIVWALDVLGLQVDDHDRSRIQRRFRDLLRAAHPDHGGAVDDAARRIQDLTEARRILLET